MNILALLAESPTGGGFATPITQVLIAKGAVGTETSPAKIASVLTDLFLLSFRTATASNCAGLPRGRGGRPMHGRSSGRVVTGAGAPARANFYVDGFNLYNGCLRGSPHKWLDLNGMCRDLAPGRTVNLIRYFTARVSGSAARRQQVYLDALASLATVTVHTEGHFETHTVIRPLAKAPHRPWQTRSSGFAQ